MIDDETMVVARHDLALGDLEDGEIVILRLSDGAYFGVNMVGGRILDLIREPMAVRDLHGRLIAEYDVEADRCHTELLALLQQLAKCELIELRAGNGS